MIAEEWAEVELCGRANIRVSVVILQNRHIALSFTTTPKAKASGDDRPRTNVYDDDKEKDGAKDHHHHHHEFVILVESMTLLLRAFHRYYSTNDKRMLLVNSTEQFTAKFGCFRNPLLGSVCASFHQKNAIEVQFARDVLGHIDSLWHAHCEAMLAYAAFFLDRDSTTTTTTTATTTGVTTMTTAPSDSQLYAHMVQRASCQCILESRFWGFGDFAVTPFLESFSARLQRRHTTDYCVAVQRQNGQHNHHEHGENTAIATNEEKKKEEEKGRRVSIQHVPPPRRRGRRVSSPLPQYTTTT